MSGLPYTTFRDAIAAPSRENAIAAVRPIPDVPPVMNAAPPLSSPRRTVTETFSFLI